MEKTQIEVSKRIELLVSMLNTKVSYPKFTMQKVNGKMEDVPTGSFDVSPFSDKEISTLKALLFLDVQDSIDGGRLQAISDKRNSEMEEARKIMLDAKKEAEAGEVEHQITQG